MADIYEMNLTKLSNKELLNRIINFARLEGDQGRRRTMLNFGDEAITEVDKGLAEVGNLLELHKEEYFRRFT